jgi:L-iditol 2-dehydrogenase
MAVMRVSELRGVGDVAVVERETPRPAEGELLVEVGSVGVCGSDVHYYEDGRIGPHVVESPLVLGHEAGGVVAAVGPRVTTLSVDSGCRSSRGCRAEPAHSASPGATTCAPT